jgi:hypothetical protein
MMNIRRIERQCTQLREAKPTRSTSHTCTLHRFGSRPPTTSDTEHDDTRTEHKYLGVSSGSDRVVSNAYVSTRSCDEHGI